MLTRIHCDTCGHNIDKQDPTEWHGKPCPECGAPDMINDGDMIAYHAVCVFELLGLVKTECDFDNPPKNGVLFSTKEFHDAVEEP